MGAVLMDTKELSLVDIMERSKPLIESKCYAYGAIAASKKNPTKNLEKRYLPLVVASLKEVGLEAKLIRHLRNSGALARLNFIGFNAVARGLFDNGFVL